MLYNYTILILSRGLIKLNYYFKSKLYYISLIIAITQRYVIIEFIISYLYYLGNIIT